MVFGFALFAIGYVLFYWGLHHMPGLPRYSMWVLSGLDAIYAGMHKGAHLATLASAGGGGQQPVQFAIGNAPPPETTQSQQPSNGQTPTPIKGTGGAGGKGALTGQQAVSIAKQWLGTPYQWGGGHSGPVPVGTPVDCSGLVNQVFNITGTTYTQEGMGTGVSSLDNALPGDLVFFGPLVPNEAYHVGIYTGQGLMIDAPHTGTVVRYDTVQNFGQIAAIRRLVPPAPVAV